MRRPFALACLAGPLLLGGCAEMAAVNAVASAIDGLSAAGTQVTPDGPMTFEQAATTACAQQTLQYGAVRISIVNLEQRNSEMLYVSGQFETATGHTRPFACAFGSNGQVAEFRT